METSAAEYTPCPPPPMFTFLHGVLLGQGSILVFVVLFLKLVVFESPPTQSLSKRRQGPRSNVQNTFSSSPNLSTHSSDSNILDFFGYDLASHSVESVDWLNVFLAQAFTGYRSMVFASGPEGGSDARTFVEDALNASKPSEPENLGLIAVDYIHVTEVDFGDRFPQFSYVRVRPSEETGRVRIEAELDYSDHLTLAVDTKVLVNFPRPRFAILPVSLGVTLARFSATVSVEIPPNPTSEPPELLTCIHPDFELDLTSTSLIGSRAKLQDIPKIEQLIVSRIRGWIVDRLVWPRKSSLRLPNVAHEAVESDSASANQSGHPPVSLPTKIPEDDYVWVDENDTETDENADDVAATAETSTATMRSGAGDALSPANTLDIPNMDVSIDSDLGMPDHNARSFASKRSPPRSTSPDDVTPSSSTFLYKPVPHSKSHEQPSSVIPNSVDDSQQPQRASQKEKSFPGHLPRDESAAFVDGGDIIDFGPRSRRAQATNGDNFGSNTAEGMRRRSFQSDLLRKNTTSPVGNRPFENPAASTSATSFSWHQGRSSGPTGLGGPFDHLRQRTGSTAEVGSSTSGRSSPVSPTSSMAFSGLTPFENYTLANRPASTLSASAAHISRPPLSSSTASAHTPLVSSGGNIGSERTNHIQDESKNRSPFYGRHVLGVSP